MRRKLIRCIFVMIAVMIMLFPVVSGADSAKLILSDTEMTIPVKKSATIKATVEGLDKKERVSYKWQSSDEAVATVKNGSVKALTAGKTDITCIAELTDGTTLTETTAITVIVPVSSIKFIDKAITLAVNNTTSIDISINPADATEKGIKWISGDENIVSVDQNGTIKGISPGKTFIMAESAENTANPKKAQINILITQSVTDISLSESSLLLAKGKNQRIEVTVTPNDATDKKIDWVSSDESIAKADKNGNVSAVGCGSCILTGTTVDGSNITVTLPVTVFQSVTSIQPSDKQWNILDKGETKTLSVLTAPKDATNPTVTWSSSDEAIATVDENGCVTAMTYGDCVVSATTNDGSNLSATFKIAVVPEIPVKIEGITTALLFDYANPEAFNVTATNKTENRTIKSFKGIMRLYDKNDKLAKEHEVAWERLHVGPIKPGKTVDPGEHYWVGKTLAFEAKRYEFLLTEVVYSDGLKQKIPEDKQLIYKWTNNITVE